MAFVKFFATGIYDFRGGPMLPDLMQRYINEILNYAIYTIHKVVLLIDDSLRPPLAGGER